MLATGPSSYPTFIIQLCTVVRLIQVIPLIRQSVQNRTFPQHPEPQIILYLLQTPNDIPYADRGHPKCASVQVHHAIKLNKQTIADFNIP
jgi:hypothetical protein